MRTSLKGLIHFSILRVPISLELRVILSELQYHPEKCRVSFYDNKLQDKDSLMNCQGAQEEPEGRLLGPRDLESARVSSDKISP